MTYPIPAEALKESVAIIGRTGSGKTFAAKGAVEMLLRDGARVCIVDPTGVWHGLRSSASGKAPGFPVVVFGGDHADVPISEASGPPLAQLIGSQNLPAIVDVSDFSSRGRTRFMTAFLDALYRTNRNQVLTLVFDEADAFAPQRVQPDETAMLGKMEQICRRGRVRGFRPWLITQRPASLAKSVLSQANTLVAMQLTAPQDRDAVGAWIEGQADREVGKRILAELPKLPRGEGWIWSPSHDVLRRAPFPAIETFDSGRTPEEGETPKPLRLAQVDLSTIGDSLRAAEAEIADSDPKVLRARIRELEVAAKKPAIPDKAAIDQAYESGIAEGARIAVGAIETALDVAREKLLDVAAVHASRKGHLSLVDTTADETKPPIHATKPPSYAPKRPSPATNGGSEPLARAERRILTALAQYPQGRSKVQVAVLTAYSSGGGGFNNAISALRTKAYLTGDAHLLVITSAGAAALGTFDPLPHGRALLDHWYGQLGKAERKTLETLAEVYPRTLSKVAIANRAGYEANGGGFNNALSRLRTLELIQGRAEMRASPDFFE